MHTTYLFAQMRLCNPFPAPIFEAPKTFCMENMPSVTATPRYPLLRIGNSLHFIYVAIDEAFCSTVSNTHILRARSALVLPMLVLLLCFEYALRPSAQMWVHASKRSIYMCVAGKVAASNCVQESARRCLYAFVCL